MKRCLIGILFLLIFTGTASGNISVLGGLVHERTAGRGDIYEGIIRISNDGEVACGIRIYQTDYVFQADGTTFYGDPGTNPRSNAGWVSINPSWLTIPGRSTVSIHYEVEVPADEDLDGSYWSLLMIEPDIVTSQVIGADDGRHQIGLQTLVRYGVQIVTDIGKTGNRDLRFRDKRLVTVNGRRLLEIDVENTGDTWMSPLLSVDLYDEQGEPAYHLDSGRQRIYPGCSVRHILDLTRVPKGKYRALAIVDNRDEYVFGAQYDLWVE